MKYKFILPLVISVFLFFTPFFWLKPGEMDLGGDSSRLYFYDPLRYLTSQALYGISHSGLGGDGLNYFGIPFFLLLAGLKSILESPTLLISFFHGFSLSLAFLSCYFIVKQMLGKDEEERTTRTAAIIEICACVAGMYYVFAPVSVLIWNHMLLTDNQIFLNPLIFLLLLRYVLTKNMTYLLVVLGITFLFAANFSYVGAPAFFAFYPLSLLFLVLYNRYVVHKPLPLRGIAIGVVLFFLLHAFHLAPQIVSLLTPGSPVHESVFSQEAKLDRGLGYFNALASGVKPSISLLGLQQMVPLNFFSFAFIIFPVLFVLGFIWNRRKLMLLIGIFFLITFFFVTANITTIGLNFYMLLFRIPGFSMFRVFFGQWEWVYLFFYTLLLGKSLAVVLARIKKWQGVSLVCFTATLLIVSAWPFINATLVKYSHWQSKNVSALVAMDPAYEEMLSYIRSLPIDGKILSLPLTDPGYQVIKGENDAAYEGPSTITYLAGRNEFMGFVEFESFGPSFLQAVREKNYVAVRDILAMLNIRYIYYNEDPYIYINNFPGQPYIHVRKFLPDTQEGYKELIKNLGVREIKTIGDKYHIYELDDAFYLPHIYAAGRTAYWSDYLTNLHIPLSFYTNDKRIAFYDDSKILERQPELFDDLFFKAQNKSFIFDFFKVKKLPRFVSPTVSQKPSSLLYPLIVLREKIDLARFQTTNDRYIDRSVYFIEKRINELVKWAEEIPLIGNIKSITYLSSTWVEPKLWELQKYKEYNSWEVTLARYQQSVEKLVDELDKTTQSNYSTITNKVELKSDLMKHKDKLRRAIREDSVKSIDEKKYLLNLADGMFDDILNKLNLDLPDDWIIPYEAGNPLEEGIYQVYVNKDDIKNLDITLRIDGKNISPRAMEEGEWVRFEDIVIKNKPSLPIVIKLNKIPNLVSETKWKTAEQTKGELVVQAKLDGDKQKDTRKDVTTLTVTYSYLGNTSGLIRDISLWREDSIYIISFDYLTYDNNFLFTLYERGGTKKNLNVNDTHSEILRSKEWKKFSTVILARNDAQSAFLQISKDQDDIQDENNIEGIKKIDIRNLLVLRITNSQIADPRIVFKKVAKAEETSTPQVIFTKINPTKYKVFVRGAKDPYTLVLSQTFNQKWKLFLSGNDNDAKTIRGVFARVSANILSGFMKTIGKNNPFDQNAKIIKSYANGSLNEGIHQNSFLDDDTFETWGKDPIAERTNLPVNGYANSWHIEPQDVKGKTDYTLIIEMTSQKLFYASLFVSLTGLIFVLLLFLKSFKK